MEPILWSILDYMGWMGNKSVTLWSLPQFSGSSGIPGAGLSEWPRSFLHRPSLARARDHTEGSFNSWPIISKIGFYFVCPDKHRTNKFCLFTGEICKQEGMPEKAYCGDHSIISIKIRSQYQSLPFFLEIRCALHTMHTMHCREQN